MYNQLTSNHYPKAPPHCEASHTLKGEYCENTATQSTKDGLLLCEKHARQLALEEQIACWEAILLHIELWSKIARKRDREDIVHLLDLERAEAASALARVKENLEEQAS